MMLAFAIPPAAKTLGVIVSVYGLLQILKQAPWASKVLVGWKAIAGNVLFSAMGVWVITPADQLYTSATLLTTLTTLAIMVSGSAGIHGTVKALSDPTVLAYVPGAGPIPVKVPAILVPLDPQAAAVADPSKGPK